MDQLWNSFANQMTKSRVSILYIILLRSITVMFSLSSAITLTLAILFRPWKVEHLPKATNYLEFSVFHVCRHTKRIHTCYKDPYTEAPAWFLTFQTFLLAAACCQYLATFYMIIKIFITKNHQSRKIWMSSCFSLAAAVLVFTALLIAIGYWDFEFMDDIRMYKMGWIENAETEEIADYPWYIAWAAAAMMLFTSLLCLFMHFKDSRFTRDCEKIVQITKKSFNGNTR